MSNTRLFIENCSVEGERFSWLVQELKLPVEIVLVTPFSRTEVERAAGVREVPLIQTPRQLFKGSEEVVRWLSDWGNYHQLLPTDVVAQVTWDALLYFIEQRIVPIVKRMQIRLWIENDDEFEAVFLSGVPSILKGAVRYYVRSRLRNYLRRNVETLEKDERDLRHHLKFLMGFLNNRQYFFENRLTVADITVASYLCPLLFRPKMTRGDMEPIFQWVLKIYRLHRKSSLFRPTSIVEEADEASAPQASEF